MSLGLADDLVDRDMIRHAAHGMAREIAMSAPLAVRSIRTTLRGDLADQVEGGRGPRAPGTAPPAADRRLRRGQPGHG